MTRNLNPDTSDAWSIEEDELKIGSMITATHKADDVDIVVKEYPNGACLRLQEPADLPGGYDVVFDTEFDELEAAMDDLERYADKYDGNGDWRCVTATPMIQ